MVALRWLARLSALVIAGGFVLITAGEMLSPHSNPPAHLREWVGILLLASTCAGMLLAWRRELPGALFSLASLAVFTAVIRFQRHTVHMLLALPALLFLADWLLRRRMAENHHHGA
jgi:hypothetical protein